MLFSRFSAPESLSWSLESSASVCVSHRMGCLCFACELSQCSWVFRGREEWSWHQACWDGAVKPRILNTSWPWSLGRHLSMSCHCFCHLTVPPPPFRGSSFMDGQGQQLPRLWGSLGSCCLNSNSPHSSHRNATRGLYHFPVAAVAN